MAPTLGGSFEECPPSLLDFAARDRRWCQGNLQHLAVLPARGLHWVSRLHLLTGIGSYLTAPLWLMFLVLGILISLQAQFVRPEYFPKGFSLFPKWPAQDPILAAWVFVGTMGLLIVPKLLACILLLTPTANRRQIRRRACAFSRAFVIETLLSGLIAPVMMIFQSTAVGEILLGRDAGWQVQRRDDGATAAPRIDPQIRVADPVRDRDGRQRLCGVAAAVALDDAGHCRPGALHSHRHAVVEAIPPNPRLFRTPEQTRAADRCWFAPMNWRALRMQASSARRCRTSAR